jgi:hypothetical protein
LALTLAAFIVGCGSDSNPHPVNVKPDSRIQRIGEGGAGSSSGKNQQALP